MLGCDFLCSRNNSRIFATTKIDSNNDKDNKNTLNENVNLNIELREIVNTFEL